MTTIVDNNFDKLSNTTKEATKNLQSGNLRTTGKSTEEGSGRTVLLVTDFVEIVVDRQYSLLSVRWLRPVSSNEYRQGILESGNFLLDLDVEQLLVNNQRLGMLTMEDQGWLVRTSVEAISKSKLQRLAIVSSTDILQELTNEALDCRVKLETPYFQTEYFLSEQEAFEWFGQF